MNGCGGAGKERKLWGVSKALLDNHSAVADVMFVLHDIFKSVYFNEWLKRRKD